MPSSSKVPPTLENKPKYGPLLLQHLQGSMTLSNYRDSQTTTVTSSNSTVTGDSSSVTHSATQANSLATQGNSTLAQGNSAVTQGNSTMTSAPNQQVLNGTALQNGNGNSALNSVSIEDDGDVHMVDEVIDISGDSETPVVNGK